MLVLLTAWRLNVSCRFFRSMWVGGTTLTSEPVSTRKRKPDERSLTENRRLGDRPAALVAASAGPGRLTSGSRGVYNDVLGHQTSGGTSREYQKVLEGLLVPGWQVVNESVMVCDGEA